MTNETIFSKIIRREIPADIVYETEHVLAFKDINPQAPVHILVIPKIAVKDLTAAASTAEDTAIDGKSMLGELLFAAAEIAKAQGLSADGYRVVINNGVRAGQTVFHLHVHVLGGRNFDWPPG